MILFKPFFLFLLRSFAKSRFIKFNKKIDNYSSIQESILSEIIQSYTKTKYGKELSFEDIKSYQDFSKKVPVNTYESLKKYLLEDYKSYNRSILFTKPTYWEKTSGSSGDFKLIPYNKHLLSSFKSLILLWFSDIFLNYKSLSSFRVFYSISSTTSNDLIEAPENDSEYLPKIIQFLFSKFLINPKGISNIEDPYSFKLLLSLHLLSYEDLEIIFIWSPSYLTSLLKFMDDNREAILTCLNENRTIFSYKEYRYKLPYFSQKRLLDINEHWGNWKLIWPNVKLISCWADGSSSHFIPAVKVLFPDALVQGKGLLSTEGPVSLPILNVKYPIPCFDHIFLEFLDKNNDIKLLNNLELEETYEVIMSHKSGLLRYKTGDLVMVRSFYKNVPCLSFIGRAGCVSDMTGEKINELKVEYILKDVLDFNQRGFLCAHLDTVPRYILVTDSNDEEILDKVEFQLKNIFHYKKSRDLNQLDQLEVCKVNNVEKLYNDFYIQKGLKWGDIKFSFLIKEPETTKELMRFISKNE